MATTVRIPAGPDNVDIVLARWHKQPGDAVRAREPLAQLAAGNKTFDFPAPAGGVLLHAAAAEGAVVCPGGLLASSARPART